MIITDRANCQGTIAERIAASGLPVRAGGTEAGKQNHRLTNLLSEAPKPNQLRVLVPMDFSESARAALKEALRLAHQPGDAVFLFYVLGFYGRTAQDRAALANPFRLNIPETYGRQFLEWSGADTAPGVRVEVLPLMGLPDAEVITGMVRQTGSSLLVVVKRSYTFWERLCGDWPTRNLSRIAHCAVRVLDDASLPNP
jgi:nucleotide-binding universal stress UspA family protein